MSNPKTVVLENLVVELPEPDVGKRYSETVSSQVFRFFSTHAKGAGLTEADYKTYLEALLWSDDYSSETKGEIAKYFSSHFVAEAWLFENLGNVDLWRYGKNRTFTSELIPYAVKNKNLFVTGLSTLLYMASAEVAEEFVISLTAESLPPRTMNALLILSEEHEMETLVRSRIACLLGLENDIPYSWLLQVVESLRPEEGEND